MVVLGGTGRRGHLGFKCEGWSQTQKALSCMTPLSMKCPEQANHRDRRQISDCQRLGEGRMGSECLMGTGFLLR